MENEESFMKIVVLDGYTLNPGDLSWKWLSDFGEYKVYQRTPEELIKERIEDSEILLINKTPITRKIIENKPNLKYIGVLATGYNVVDVVAAKENGVVVTNISTYGTVAVAQFTLALLLEICSQVSIHSDSVHKGEWEGCKDFCYWKHPLMELQGKTAGIIGYGKIGQAFAKAVAALGMNVVVYNPRIKKNQESEKIRYISFQELLDTSDVISLHCPLLKDTEGIINKKTISSMKDGVIILNTARGPLVEEQDLADALNSGKVYAAGLDVVSTEPIKPDNPLLKAKNCWITPHIAWVSIECRERLMNIAMDNLKAFIEGQPINVV